MENYSQITTWCRAMMELFVNEGDICIDATAGNGNDTLFLCERTGKQGKVYAFDIQEKAICATREKTTAAGYAPELYLAGHETMGQYVKEAGEVSLVVFNFGYLPGGNHEIHTQAKTSIEAITAGLQLLKKGGALCLCIYSGGDSGFEEKDAILSYLKQLDSKQYLVLTMEYYNRPNHPPMPVLVQKLR